ncbi:MAG: zinc ABC transporter substrate-binding protein [Erysipelotrichia bacterium]|nr:zinc ABC transporter substrate-binding protein [Erysipelotrichia bacterium]
MKFLISMFFLITIVSAQTNIVVSIAPQKTFVEKIGGEKVKVSTMVKAGSDPHTYEPKPSQMKDISNANIYFPIGLEFEKAWLDKFASQNKNMKFIDMTKGVEYIEMQEHHHHDEDEHEHHEANNHEEEHNKDPHVWVSPSIVKIMAKNIYDALVEIDSLNKDYFEKNYLNFIEEINQTDKKIKEILSVLPENSKFMVFHPSWGYFAKEYNLIQIPIEVEGKEPKPKVLQKIIDEAKEENVKAIFTQAEFSDKSAKTIASQLKIKVLKETPLAKNWSENLIKMATTIANNN